MGISKHTVKTTCKFCRKEFASFGLSKVCNECEQTMESNLNIIKAYLNEFPDATVAEVCHELNIPSALIKFYLKEERLVIKGNKNNYFLRCGKCNKPITSGRYCFECEIEVQRSDMKGVLTKNKSGIEEDSQMEKEIARFHTTIINHRKK